MRLTALPSANHYAEAHFPGLFSIVISRDGGCLDRVFIAAPGQLHPHLTRDDSPFLWHAHGYDFTEVTLAGSVRNIVVERVPNPNAGGRYFHAYRIEAGIDSGRLPTIARVGCDRFKIVRDRTYQRSCGFTMKHDAVHRVVFRPCQKTGWFACRVLETEKHPAPDIVYCRHEIGAVPNADRLYQRISTDEAQHVLDAFAQSEHLLSALHEVTV